MHSSHLKAVALLLTLFSGACSGNSATLSIESSNETAQQAAIQRKSVREDISGLDILKDYNRDLWEGPDGWSETQWQWKKRLGWDKECDYVGEVTPYTLSDSIQLIQILCVPGSYQGMHYLYRYDTQDGSSQQLALGTADSTDNPQEIWGQLDFNAKNKRLTILTLARGLGDCGSYRVFSFDTPQSQPQLIEHRAQSCDLPANNPDEQMKTPEQWPLIAR